MQSIAQVGFISSTLAYLFLVCLLLALKTQIIQRILISVCLLSVIWGIVATWQLQQGFSVLWVLGLESLRNLMWIGVLMLSMSKAMQSSGHNAFFSHLSFRQILLLSTLLFVALLQFICAQFYAYFALYWIVVQLVLSVMGLWYIEQFYRRLKQHSRSAGKLLCLGLGAIFAFDFAMYCDALLTQSIPLAFWSLKGWVACLSAPLILLSARRMKDWSTEVYISRDVVYHSSLLLVAGAYMLVMALTGYYIRFAGGRWGEVAQLGFFILGVLLFVSVLLAAGWRKKLKVLIAKHFFANKYEYRQEWVNFAKALEKPSISPFDTALYAINGPFSCEQLLLAIEDQGQFVAVANLNVPKDCPRAKYLLERHARRALRDDWIIDFNEETDDTSYNKNGDFRLIVPMQTEGGFKGVFLLSQPRSTVKINWEDRDLIRTIAHQLGLFLEVHRVNKVLAETQQFDAFNQMSAYLVHDLKNVLAQLELLNKNALKHRHKPEFVDDAFDTVKQASIRLAKVVSHLSKKSQAPNERSVFAVKPALQEVLSLCAQRLPKPEIKHTESHDCLIQAERERFINVMAHLVNNAQDASEHNGKIHLSTAIVDKQLQLSIQDNGVGMTPEFIQQRLFKPFDTTKGNAGMGIGAFDAKRFVNQLGGTIKVVSQVGKGSEFIVRLPFSCSPSIEQ